MGPDDTRIRQRLVSQWDDLIGVIGNQSPGCSVSPDSGWESIEVVEASAEEFAKFELQPVILNVPERANHRSAELYVVVRGWLEVSRREFREQDLLITHSFSTEAGYFLLKESRLEHVYGAHYDAAYNALGHPVFHAQMKGFPEFSQHVLDIFNINTPLQNNIHGILRNVRLPTAQMDFFSLVLQVFADHLLFKNSGEEERATFNGLLERSRFLKGAAARYPRLTEQQATSCYRSLHWYPIVA